MNEMNRQLLSQKIIAFPQEFTPEPNEESTEPKESNEVSEPLNNSTPVSNISLDTSNFPLLNISPHIQSIFDIITSTWEDVDLEGMACVLAFLGAYRLHEKFPFWLHIVGGPSSGKTEIGMAPIQGSSRDHWSIDLLTPQTFLSGLAKGKQNGKQNSLLHRIGKHGLLCMSDFTTIMEQPEPVVSAIAGQLRKIYDGDFNRQTGVANPHSKWDGQLSIITAMTVPAFTAWGQYNLMGERFMALQWRAPKSSEELATKLMQHSNISEESNPRTWIRWLTASILNGPEVDHELDSIPEEFRKNYINLPALKDIPVPKIYSPSALMQPGNNIPAMAELLAKLRTVPKRHGKHQKIGRMDTWESPHRSLHQLLKAIRGWAYINHRELVSSDLLLARRIALDSIPNDRRVILSYLLNNDGRWTAADDIRESCGFVEFEPLLRHLEDLYALGAITSRSQRSSDRSTPECSWKISLEYKNHIINAFGVTAFTELL